MATRLLFDLVLIFSPAATGVLALGAAALFYRTLNGAMRSFLAFFLLQAAAFGWLAITEIGLLGEAPWLAAREVRALIFRGIVLISYGQLLWRLRR